MMLSLLRHISLITPLYAGMGLHPELRVRILQERKPGPITIKTHEGDLHWKVDSQGGWIKIPNTVRVKLSKNGSIRVGETETWHETLYFKSFAGKEVLVGNHSYLGTIQISKEQKNLLIIAKLKLEDYLERVLSEEMGWHAPLEALKAQAVAARSFALYQMRNSRHRFYDLEGSIKDQAFSKSTNLDPKIRQAVQSTKGEYLYKDTKSEDSDQLPYPLKAFYHSKCGGMTTESEKVWSDQDGPQTGVVCDYCQNNPYSWSVTVPIQEFVNIFRLSTQDFSMIPYTQTEDGRLIEIAIRSKGKNTIVNMNEFRRKLGFQRIKSARLKWSQTASHIVFTGWGLGHGVGMCQWGAIAMAKNGFSYIQILEHYYRGSRLFRPQVQNTFVKDFFSGKNRRL